jgi:hypothetical protein
MFFRKSICLGTSRVYIKKKNIFLETGVFHSSITHAAKFSIAVATIVHRTQCTFTLLYFIYAWMNLNKIYIVVFLVFYSFCKYKNVYISRFCSLPRRRRKSRLLYSSVYNRCDAYDLWLISTMFFKKSICLGTSRVYIKKKNIFLGTGVNNTFIGRY